MYLKRESTAQTNLHTAVTVHRAHTQTHAHTHRVIKHNRYTTHTHRNRKQPYWCGSFQWDNFAAGPDHPSPWALFSSCTGSIQWGRVVAGLSYKAVSDRCQWAALSQCQQQDWCDFIRHYYLAPLWLLELMWPVYLFLFSAL